jgi:hypothetical protein
MLAGATMEEQVRLLQQARDRREVFDQPEQVSSSRASSRNAWGGVREADGGGVLFITDPMTRRLSGLATSRDTSRASLLRRGHICRRWVSHCEPASGLPPSETVKLLFAVLLSHSRGAVQPVHSGISGISGGPFRWFPTAPGCQHCWHSFTRQHGAPAHPTGAGGRRFQPSKGLTWR